MIRASTNMISPRGGGEDGLPLVETPRPPSSGLCRAPSCGDNPQAGALQALQAGDLRLLSDLLSEEGLPLSPDHCYPEAAFRTLLHQALETGHLEAVRIILGGGASPSHYNPTVQVSPLHVAVAQGSKEAVSILLSALNNTNLEPRDRVGRTPLLLAASKGSPGLACLQLLLQAGASPHPVDSRGGQGALQLAAQAGCWEAVDALAAKGATATKDVKAILEQKFGVGKVAGLQLQESQEGLEERLEAELDRAQLGRSDLGLWRQLLGSCSSPSILDQAMGQSGLVQKCVERGLAQHLELLLEQGADPNTTTLEKQTSPLLLAAEQGRPEVLQLLVSNPRIRLQEVEPHLKQTVLHQVVRKPFQGLSASPADRDYTCCLKILLAQGAMAAVVNCQDRLGNTALHYATQFWGQGTELGANIGLRNLQGEAPIAGILPSTMEAFLDTSCLQSEGNPTNEDFTITFNYSFLAPPRGSEVKEIVDKEERPETRPVPETDVLWYMARSKDHRHLLKHPVITSFLALKWSRISAHYNVNILCFALFVACLTSYIFTNYAGSSLGVSQPLCAIDQVIPSNTTTLLQPYGNNQTLWVLLALLLAILIIRETVQFSIAPSQHVSSVENILEIVLIVLVGLLLFHGEPGCHLSFKREISSAILLISWIALVTMVGRHPRLYVYNIYSTMFYRVLKTFTTFLSWYCLFLLAFGLSFYILLHEDNGGEDREYAFFDHLGLCLVKTFSMFVGELEFSDIPFNSPFSYFFFITFVFLIVVVLMNLLNGLAVSETGLIREDAEIHAHVSRVEVIAQLEATLLGDPAMLLTGSGVLGRLLPSCGLRRRLGSMLRLGAVFRLLTVSKGVLLFYSVLPSKRIQVEPNRPRTLCCGPDQELRHAIGREVLKSAKDLILRLGSDEQGANNIESALEEVRAKQEQLEVKLEQVLKALQIVTAKLS